MHYYLKWYYGYKNFGDELLLLWVLKYLVQEMQMKECTIETPDPKWLDQRLQRHAEYFPTLTITYASTLHQTIVKQLTCDSIVIWWGEVITDARKAPHNGWNYLIRNYWLKLFWKKIVLLWWFWTPKSFWSTVLYWLLYTWASKIICRESASYERVSQYVSKDNVLLHEDFSYTILKQTSSDSSKVNSVIVNCNPYIWSEKTKSTIIEYCTTWAYSSVWYFPAELSVDTPMNSSETSCTYSLRLLTCPLSASRLSRKDN
jgi:polysaccharide pyruvyl transferase WcaK-like protein